MLTCYSALINPPAVNPVTFVKARAVGWFGTLSAKFLHLRV